MSRHLFGLLMCVIGLGAEVLGCADNGTALDPRPSSDPYIRVQLNAESIVMSTVAPYDTLQLTATGRLASGALVASVDSVQYSTDDTLLTVTRTGLVTAHYATSGKPTTVIATLHDRISNVTHVDTAFITITEQVPGSPLTTFALHSTGDSARVAIQLGGAYPVDTMSVVATTTGGTDISSALPLRFFTSDPNVAMVDPQTGLATGIRRGAATIYATSTYYGVTKRDSVILTILNPILVTINATAGTSPVDHKTQVWLFSPATVTISPGGIVEIGSAYLPTWDFPKLQVVFDDPSAAQAAPFLVTYMTPGVGNIGPVEPYAIGNPSSYVLNPNCPLIFDCLGGARAFPTPGIYRYHDPAFGMSGAIIVQ
jgi:hypothetical protein